MTYEELINNPAYEKLDAFSHKNIKHVVMKENGEGGKWGRLINTYLVMALIAVAVSIVMALIPFVKRGQWDNLLWVAGGILFSVIFLSSVHELIHAAAYKLLGAKKLAFEIRLNKLLFYVFADKHVFNFREFKLAALAPFIIVSVLSIIGMALTYGHAAFYSFLSIFGIHSLFCSTDFGILSYFDNRKEREIVLFDDKEDRKTYFYARKEREEEK